MVARVVGVLVALTALLALIPVFAFAAVGIWLSSPGPVFFRANRVGLNGRMFCMYKFRTMRVAREPGGSTITAKGDPRVFAFGSWLRRLQIDELPQLFNIVKGDMAIVGPRPEDPRIVRSAYAAPHLETLQVLPGLTSPGTLYYYMHGEQRIDVGAPERYYVEHLLPTKLALDRAYVREASALYDLQLVLRTIWTIVLMAMGVTTFREPPELAKARDLVCPTRPEATNR
jgi:lipopolysaccharide/colanic/teichoic acid biosynthesis glycosyltransferase